LEGGGRQAVQSCAEIRYGQGGPWSKMYQRDQSQTRRQHLRR
jgi:hypothetical protein